MMEGCTGRKRISQQGKATGREREEMYRYHLLEWYSECYRCALYGIVQEEWVEEGWKVAASVRDIGSNRAEVVRLLQRCNSGQPSPVHLLDVAVDFIS